MKEVWQFDHCYPWISNKRILFVIYLRKNRLNYDTGNLGTTLKHNAILEIPDLDIHTQLFCGNCQCDKQIRTSHKSFSECYTIKILEWLHIDLMGPIQTESFGRKKHVFVCVDNDSRFYVGTILMSLYVLIMILVFTWVRFLRGYYWTREVCLNLCLSPHCQQGKNIVRMGSDHGRELMEG